jgi:hypothetical protein
MDIEPRAKELEALCASYRTAFKLTPSPYWSAEIYGFGKYLRKYGYFPSFLPLCVHTDHGPGVVMQFKSELTSSAPVQLFHSPTSVADWKRVSKKPCYCFFSPAVFGRRVNGVTAAPDAKGTIAFPAHTTIHLEDRSNVNVYMDQLRGLPAEYQPVGICLHPTDVLKGLHRAFLARGFEVNTAGHFYDDAFSDRFYDIIRRYRYGTSNYLGSYAYYCVEMGIPFFLYGQEPDYVNIDDPTAPLGRFSPVEQSDSHREAHLLFASVTTTISPQQKEYAERHLGMLDGLNRPRMAGVLYYSLVSRVFSIESLGFIGRRVRQLLRMA